MTTTYRVGNHLVGIRANTGDCDRALRQAFASRVVAEAEAPFAFYSLRIEQPVSGVPAQPLHALYEGGCLIVRSRRPEVVLAALARQLSVRELAYQGEPLIRCVVLAKETDQATLLSAALQRQAALQANRLAAAGLELIATPAVLVGDGTSTVVVPPPAVLESIGALAALAGGDVVALERELAPHQMNVTSWVFLSAHGSLSPIARAQAVALARQALIEGVPAAASLIRGLSRVLRQATPLGAGDLDTWDVVQRLASIPGHN